MMVSWIWHQYSRNAFSHQCLNMHLIFCLTFEFQIIHYAVPDECVQFLISTQPLQNHRQQVFLILCTWYSFRLQAKVIYQYMLFNKQPTLIYMHHNLIKVWPSLTLMKPTHPLMRDANAILAEVTEHVNLIESFNSLSPHPHPPHTHTHIIL